MSYKTKLLLSTNDGDWRRRSAIIFNAKSTLSFNEFTKECAQKLYPNQTITNSTKINLYDIQKRLTPIDDDGDTPISELYEYHDIYQNCQILVVLPSIHINGIRDPSDSQKNELKQEMELFNIRNRIGIQVNQDLKNEQGELLKIQSDLIDGVTYLKKENRDLTNCVIDLYGTVNKLKSKSKHRRNRIRNDLNDLDETIAESHEINVGRTEVITEEIHNISSKYKNLSAALEFAITLCPLILIIYAQINQNEPISFEFCHFFLVQDVVVIILYKFMLQRCMNIKKVYYGIRSMLLFTLLRIVIIETFIVMMGYFYGKESKYGFIYYLVMVVIDFNVSLIDYFNPSVWECQYLCNQNKNGQSSNINNDDSSESKELIIPSQINQHGIKQRIEYDQKMETSNHATCDPESHSRSIQNALIKSKFNC